MTKATWGLGWLLLLGLLSSAATAQTAAPAKISAGGFHSCGLNTSGGADCWGANGYGQLSGSANAGVSTFSQPGPYVSVSSGDLHSCGLRQDGGIDCWGRNGDGQLDGGLFGTVDSTT